MSDKIKVSATDIAEGYLEDKLVGGSNATITKVSSGGVEYLQIDVADTAASDIVYDGYQVKVDSDDSASDFLINKLTAGSNIDISVVDVGGIKTIRFDVADQSTQIASVDAYYVKVDADDTVADFIANKIVAGSNIEISILDNGGSKSIVISAVDQATAFSFNDGYQVKVSDSDSVPDFLGNKLVAGDNIALSVIDSGGTQTIRFDVLDQAESATYLDSYQGKVSTSDTVPDYLSNKLVAGSNIELSVVNINGAETIRFDVADQSINQANNDSYKAAVDENDNSPDYLVNKITAGSNITINVVDVAGAKTMRLDVQDYDLTHIEEVIGYVLGPDGMDGYASKYTEADHYRWLSEAVNHLQVAADGYGQGATEAEHYAWISDAIKHLKASADAYGVNIDEHYRAHSDAFNSIFTDLDGYQVDINDLYSRLAALDSTFVGNKNAQYQVNQTIIQALDGYAQNDTISEHYNQLSESINQLIVAVDGYMIAEDVNTHLIPAIDDIYNIGSQTRTWAQIFGNSLNISHARAYTETASTPSWTKISTSGYSTEQGYLCTDSDGYLYWAVSGSIGSNNNGIYILKSEGSDELYSESTYHGGIEGWYIAYDDTRDLIYFSDAVTQSYRYIHAGAESYPIVDAPELPGTSVVGAFPGAIAVNKKNGKIYIASSPTYNTIYEKATFEADLTVWGSTTGILRGIRIDSLGQFLLVNESNTLYRHDLETKERILVRSFIELYDFDIDNYGNIYTAHRDSNGRGIGRVFADDLDSFINIYTFDGNEYPRPGLGIVRIHVLSDTYSGDIGSPGNIIVASGTGIWRLDTSSFVTNYFHDYRLRARNNNFELYDGYNDGYILTHLRDGEKLGIYDTAPNELLTVGGIVSLKDSSAPATTNSGYGKIYVNSSKLYYQDDGGNTYNLAEAAAYIDNISGVENAISTILKDLDGYSLTESQHYHEISTAIDHLRVAADGYDSRLDAAESTISSHTSQISGLGTTVVENKNAQYQINQSVLQALDGYTLNTTESEHYRQHSVSLDHIIQALNDGYADVHAGMADGYIAFYTGPTSMAGDNDLRFDRENNKLVISNLQLTGNSANLGYVLTADNDGNASWSEPAPGGSADFSDVLTIPDGASDFQLLFDSDGNVLAKS